MNSTQADAGLNDPDVKVPAAVARAAARANAAHEAAYKDPNAPDPAAPDPAADPPAPDPAADPPARSPKVEPGSWEQQYLAMRGRFDGAQGQLRAQGERLAGLEATLATLATAKPTPAELRTDSLLTTQERQDYGDEFLDVTARAAREKLSPDMTAMKDKIAELEAKVGKVDGNLANDARSRMLTELTTKVPPWRAINEDPRFFAWLDLQDPFSGAIRMNLLRSAFDGNDTSRVLAFFNGFLAEEAAVANATEVARPVKPEKVSLASLAAPGRARSAAPDGPAEKPIITGAYITKFYEDVRRGLYAGKEADKKNLEAQIFEAQREGRIR